MTTATAPATATKNGNGKAKAPSVDAIAKKLREQIVPEMDVTLVQRSEEITLLILSMIARTHLALIGEKGTAKSLALDTFMSHVDDSDVRMFKTTIRKGTNLEELFGPPSVKRMLEDDIFEYATDGTLVEANIAMLGEIWKGNSAILNSLLSVINERQFKNGAQMMQVPLWTLIADSNELPPPSENDLMAMRDRFGATKLVTPVKTQDGLLSVLDTQLGNLSGTHVAPTHTTITRSEIEALQAQVKVVAENGIPANVRQAYVSLQMKATVEGLSPSVRRNFEGMKLAMANAVLNGRDTVTKEDLRVFAHNLWTFPEESKIADKLVLEFAGQTAKKAAKFRDALEDIARNINEAAKKLPSDGSQPDASVFGEIGVQNSTLTNLRKRVNTAYDEAVADGDDTRELASLKAAIEQQQSVVKKALYQED